VTTIFNDTLPLSVLTDSYKAGHFAQYPAAKLMVAYGEAREVLKETSFEFFCKCF
jgi:hypothetical protein